MKKIMHFLKLASLAAIVLVLISCGGGGGGGGSSSTTIPQPSVPVVVTITCPDGTSAATATACPQVTLAVTPADGSVNTSPDTFTSVKATSTGTLDATTVVVANVTLKAGGITPVAGTLAVAVDNKSFTFAPSAKLGYLQSYTFAVSNVKDSVGNAVPSVTVTFTTASVSCTAPLVPDGSGTTCVVPTCPPPATFSISANTCLYPMGTWVTSPNQLPGGCTLTSQSCWTDFVSRTDGTGVKAVDSGILVGGRAIGVYYFINNATAFGVTGLWNTLPFYIDTGALFGGTINSGGSSVLIDGVYGYSDGTGLAGFILHGGGMCVDDTYDPVGGTIGSSGVVACAPGAP